MSIKSFFQGMKKITPVKQEIIQIKECHNCANIFGPFEDGEKQPEKCENCDGVLFDYEESIPEGTFWDWLGRREQELYTQYVVGNSENEKKYEIRQRKGLEFRKKLEEELKETKRQRQAEEAANRPHCPHCGSVNLREETSPISTGESYIFVDTIVCNNCGYHWDV